MTEKKRQTQRQRERETEIERETERQREAETERKRQTETKTHIICGIGCKLQNIVKCHRQRAKVLRGLLLSAPRQRELSCPT